MYQFEARRSMICLGVSLSSRLRVSIAICALAFVSHALPIPVELTQHSTPLQQVAPTVLSDFLGGTLAWGQASPAASQTPAPSATPLAAAAPEASALPAADLTAAPTVPAVTFETIIEKAKALAASDFVDSSEQKAGKEWASVSYDEYRSIRFRPEMALWKGSSPFEVQLFHPGFLYDRAVTINLVEEGKPHEVPFDRLLFRYDNPRLNDLPAQLPGYAGFRVTYPLHSNSRQDEVIVFLGASYFKFLGRQQKYGLSARGLAIDTALPKGEEFPFFKEFWLVKPAELSRSMTAFAILDSPSVTGAYRFTITPSTSTQVAVSAVLFFRHAVDKVGLAPLTSMFLFGENRHRVFQDFRSEVHDSDGLLLHTGSGEWVWRPLQNWKYLQLSSFNDSNPTGFGLLQRDRNFDHYQDLESLYHQRASYWVEPKGHWGAGHVELVEIPADHETNDNVAAYWVPRDTPTAGTQIEISYTVTSYLDGGQLSPNGKVVATREGTARRPGSMDSVDDRGRLFVIDFDGGELPLLEADQPIDAVVSVSSGRVANVTAQKNAESGGWRIFFDFFPERDDPAELRAFLKLRGDVLSETWSYLWKPE